MNEHGLTSWFPPDEVPAPALHQRPQAPALMPQAYIEAGLLASVGISVERLNAIDEAGLTLDDFIAWGSVLAMMRGHVKQYGTLPTADQIRMRHPDWNPPVGEFAWWLEEMRRIRAVIRAQTLIREALPGIEDDPATAIPRLAEMLSAEYGKSQSAESIFPIRTATELIADVSPGVDWILSPWLARGAVTEIAGKAKAAGKSTFVLHALRAITSGDSFLGETPVQSPALYLTEERTTTFVNALRRAGLQDNAGLHVLFHADVADCFRRNESSKGGGNNPWPQIMDAAMRAAQKIGAGIIVVDTIAAFAGLRGEQENSAGDALEAMAPLQRAAAEGFAVVAVRHERKGGGEVGESGRGSSAFTGAADIVIRIARSDGKVKPSLRVLTALSRFDETPDTLVIDLTDNGYVALGDERAVTKSAATMTINELLPTSESEAVALNDLLEGLREHGRFSRTTVQETLAEMAFHGMCIRTGSGRKGQPFRYYRDAEPQTAEASSDG